MNKKLRWITVVVAAVVFGLILAYKFLLPTYLASIISNETAPSYIPEKYKIQIERIHKPLNKYTQEVFKISDSLNISLELILKIIDSVDPDEVMDVYYKLENKNITSSEEVFDIIKNNITIDVIDISMYKKPFLKYATPARINRALRYAETHELVTTLAPSTAKKVAKQIVTKHYEEKKRELQLN